MNKNAISKYSTSIEPERNLDELMSSLFVQLTHHSITNCPASAPTIVKLLELLSSHSELEFFPQQQKVIIKMQHLWKTRMFLQKVNKQLH